MLKRLFLSYLASTNSSFFPLWDLFLLRLGRRFVHPPQIIPDSFEKQVDLPAGATCFFDELLQNPNTIMHARWKEASIRGESYLEYLYAITRLSRPNFVIEIGRDRGRTLAQLSLAIKANGVGTIISIDPSGLNGINPYYVSETCRDFKFGVREFEKDNVPGNFPLFSADLHKSIKLIVGFSHEKDIIALVKDLLKDSCDMLFIDGDHEYDGVKKDFDIYSPLVRQGGYIIFDDAYVAHWGVHKLLSEIAANNQNFAKVNSTLLPYFDTSKKLLILKKI